MQFTITGEDQYGEQVELTLESAADETTSVELTILGDDTELAFPIVFDLTEIASAVAHVNTEINGPYPSFFVRSGQ